MQFLEIHPISLDIEHYHEQRTCTFFRRRPCQPGGFPAQPPGGPVICGASCPHYGGNKGRWLRTRHAADGSRRRGVRHHRFRSVHEGAELRLYQPSAAILVFEVPRSETLPAALNHHLELTTVSEETTDGIEDAARRSELKVRVHVKVDTGMGRLGLPPAGALRVVERVARSRWLELAGVYSHFATSEDPEQEFAREQLSRFQDLLDAVQRSPYGE
jgi:hypothetical protein